MRILVSSIGTLGDLFPVLSVAHALRAAGAEVVVGAQADHVARVEADGFSCCEILGSLADAVASSDMSASEIVHRAMTDTNYLFDAVLPHDLEAATRRLADFAGDVELVACTLTAEAAKLVAELKGVPCVPLVLQPLSAMLAEDPPYLPDTPVFRLDPGTPLGVAWNRLMIRAATWDVKRRHGPKVAAARAGLGLGPLQAPPYLGYPVEPPFRLGLYSHLLHGGRTVPDEEIAIMGACRYVTDESLAPALADFLTAGDAPIVFTLGSMAAHIGGDFFAASVAAARALRRRAVLLTGGQAVPVDASEDLLVADWAPHAALFSRCVAIVHHGGAGTSAEALLSGRPQLVVPVGSDQPDNARRLQRLGVASVIPATRYHAQQATTRLARLVDGRQVTENAATLSTVAASEPGAAGAAARLMLGIRA